MKPHIYIFDVNSIFGRAFPHTNKRVMDGKINSSDFIGETPVYALRETLRLIKSEINYLQHNFGSTNTHIVMVCDAPGDNFRHRLYPQYKSGRPPKPEHRKIQENLLYDMLIAAGYPCLRVDDVEADDVMSTLTTKLSAHGILCTMFTGDKDLMSLCNENVFIYYGKVKKLIDVEYVEKKFGMKGSRVLDFLALAGDSVDSVPGVTGIADVSAKELLSLFEFNDLIADPDIILGSDLKRKKSLHLRMKEGKKEALLSRSLVELKCDVELGMNFKNMLFTQPQPSKFLPYFFQI
jgi:DNA polymerase-1